MLAPSELACEPLADEVAVEVADGPAAVCPASGPASSPAMSWMTPPFAVTLILGEGCSAVSEGEIQWTIWPLL